MDKVRSKLPAKDILRELDEEYESTHPNSAFLFQQILSAAREHDHSELITLLCEDPEHYSNYMALLLVLSPLALTFSDLPLMKEFLCAGAPLVGNINPYPTFGSTPYCLFVSSIFEQACVLDQPEALELLLSYDTDTNPER